MKFANSTSIETRLKVVFYLAVASCLVSFFVGFSATVFFYSGRTFIQELTSIASVIGATSRASLAFNDADSGQRVLSGLSAKRNIIYATLRKLDGEILAEYGRKPAGFVSPGTVTNEMHQWSFSNVQLTIPILLENEIIGSISLVSSLETLYYQFLLFLLIGTGVTLVAALISAYLSSQLRRWVSEPIASLKEVAQRVSVTKDFSRRLEVTGEDEVHQLIRAFNHMLEQLEERDRELVLAKNRAEEADRVKSTFLATMSHELRTPLHAILGMTDEVLCLNNDDEQKELLEIVKNSGKLLISIINDILDFSKIEAGKLILFPSIVNLEESIKKVFQMFTLSARKKGVQLSDVIDDDVPKEIKTDGGRFVQILVNLIGNGLKYTPNGSVQLRVKKHDHEGLNGKVALHFIVTDTGLGIPEEALKNIFESFTQVRREGEAAEGTGLGLAISARLVELMGGSIWATSKLGKGSEFNFIIECELPPLAPAIEGLKHVPLGKSLAVNEVKPIATSERKPPSVLRGQTILVVEDNRVNSMLAERVLRNVGYQVIIAENGQRCLDVLAQSRVDLVLMDLDMPVMNGIIATTKIRELEADSLKHMPIIALTAMANDEQASICLQAGMDAYLVKPLDRQTLLTSIAKYLSSVV